MLICFTLMYTFSLCTIKSVCKIEVYFRVKQINIRVLQLPLNLWITLFKIHLPPMDLTKIFGKFQPYRSSILGGKPKILENIEGHVCHIGNMYSECLLSINYI